MSSCKWRRFSLNRKIQMAIIGHLQSIFFDHFRIQFLPVLNGVLIFPSNLLLSFFRFCLMSTLIWACVFNIRSKVTIFITYIPRKNGERNYTLNALKWNCWPKISHRIQRFVINVYDPSSVEDFYYFYWFWSFSQGRQDYCKQFISYLLFWRTYLKSLSAKNTAITVKKLWTWYTINHQGQLTWDN